MINYYLIILIFFILIFIFLNKNNLVYIEGQNGLKFLINEDTDKQNKIKLLSKIIENMYKLKNYMVYNINKFPEYKEYINQLNENFTEKRTTIYETDPTSDLTSFSVNKGEELSICLKSKKTGELHDINLLMYVVIHEMAHFACPDVGHGLLFKKIFKKFIEEAININLYKKVDYSEHPVEYCGMTLSSSII
jgi:predicted metal-dependent hydrolase